MSAFSPKLQHPQGVTWGNGPPLLGSGFDLRDRCPAEVVGRRELSVESQRDISTCTAFALPRAALSSVSKSLSSDTGQASTVIIAETPPNQTAALGRRSCRCMAQAIRAPLTLKSKRSLGFGKQRVNTSVVILVLLMRFDCRHAYTWRRPVCQMIWSTAGRWGRCSIAYIHSAC